MALPTSATWDLADFNEATLGSMLTLGPGEVTIAPSTFPYFTYTDDFKILAARSDDGALARIDLETPVPSLFTVEFEARFQFMPNNLGDLENRRAGLTIADDAGRGVSIYFATTGLAVSRIDDFGSVTALPDTTELTEEISSRFKTVRVSVDSGLGRAYIYIDGQFRYIVPVVETPDGVLDTFAFFVKGTPTEPSQIEFRRLQLAGTLLIPNFPPVADAGADRVAPVGQAVRFDGRGSFDVEGAQLTYKWTAIDAPLGSDFAAENGSGNTTDDGDSDAFTTVLSFPSNGLPDWVSAGDILRIAGGKHVIASADVPGGTLTVESDTIPDDITSSPFRVIRQSLLVGAETETPYAVPDVQGIYRCELVVNDGEIDSEPAEVLANIVGARAPFGVEPDVSPIWKALGDEWRFIENRGVFEEGWRAAAQILGGKLLEAWQYHYNFSIKDAQRTFQTKWVPFRTLITETAQLDAEISPRFGLLRASHAFEDGDPAVTGETLVFEYPSGYTPTDVATVEVTLTWNDLATIVSDCNAALAGTGIEAYGYPLNTENDDYRALGEDGWAADDGDGNRVTSVFRFPVLSLPAWVDVGDLLVVGGRRYTIAGYNPGAGIITTSIQEIPDNIGVQAEILGITDLATLSYASLVGETLEFTEDGLFVSVTFSAAVTNPASLVAEINAAAPVDVAYVSANGTLLLRSMTAGTGSTMVIEAGTTVGAASLLGLTVGDSDTGSGVNFRVYRCARLGFRSTSKGFRILASSTAATALGLDTDTYAHLRGETGAVVTDKTYFAGDGVDLGAMGVRRGDLLILNNGQAFRIDRTITHPTDPLENQRLLLFDDLPFDATAEWDIPSIVRSSEVDYELEGSYPGDLVKVEVYNTDDGNTTDLSGRVVGQQGRTVAAHLDDFYGVFGGADEQYELRLLGIKRRKALALPDDVVSIPQLQDLIPVSASPTTWREQIDYILEPFYREEDGSAVPMLQFRDSVFIDPDTEPPDVFWAEFVVWSNEGNVENLFGRLTGFLRDDASNFDRDFNYVAGVAGLMYAQQRGPRVQVMKIGAQILLGQPFAEVDGIVTEVRFDYSPTRGRLVIQDDDGNTPSRSEIFRSYFYAKDPLDLSETSGLEVNPDTGVPWAVGDKIPQFSPIGAGVGVVDLYNDPKWWVPFVRSGVLTELEKFHSFATQYNLDLVSLANISLLSSFVYRVKPTYTHPILLGLRLAEEDVDVVDDLDMSLVFHLVAAPCYATTGTGEALIYDDYRGDGTLWATFDGGTTYYDGAVDCPLDLIDFILTMVWAGGTPTYDSILFYDTDLIDVSADPVLGLPGTSVPIDYDMNLAAGTYRVTVAIKSGGVVVP